MPKGSARYQSYPKSGIRVCHAEPPGELPRVGTGQQRTAAWRTLIVAAINEGLRKGLFGLAQGEDWWPMKTDGIVPRLAGHMFAFRPGRGMRVCVALVQRSDGMPSGSLAITACAAPSPLTTAALLTGRTVAFLDGAAVAAATLERLAEDPALRSRAHVATMHSWFASVDQGLIEALAAVSVEPSPGYSVAGGEVGRGGANKDKSVPPTPVGNGAGTPHRS